MVIRSSEVMTEKQFLFPTVLLSIILHYICLMRWTRHSTDIQFRFDLGILRTLLLYCYWEL